MADDAPRVLYDEGPCLAVWKPGGLLTQAPPGIDSLEAWVREWLAEHEDRTARPYVGLPHRLDRPASGVVLVGKHRRATRRLAEQFEGRIVTKRYWALVEGLVEPPSGMWEDWLRKIPGRAHAERVDSNVAGARRARLRYHVKARTDDCTWLEIELLTGRTHQIRVQTSCRGHAILGDEQYGAVRPFGPDRCDPRERWIALHGRSIRFKHPVDRGWRTVTAPLPDIWSDVASASSADRSKSPGGP